jgi:transposase-like protein
VDDLPPQNIRRWMPSRKAAVVVAVRDSRITMAEALHRYQLTEEEFRSWQRAFERHGLAGLRATRIRQYREPRQPQRSRKLRSHYDPVPSPSNPQ